MIRNLVLDFIFRKYLYYMRKYPIHVTWAQGKKKHQIYYALLEEVSKKHLWQTSYNSDYTQNNEKCTYNVIIHWNLLHVLKIWNCLNFIQKGKTNFFCLIKLLFIKVRCLINVNVSLEALLEGQGWWATLFNTICWF